MKTKAYIVIALGLMLLGSCSDESQVAQRTAFRTDSMDISEVKVELPNIQGRDLVEMSCMPCHSLRYIEMQPDMTKKSWEKIVAKMIKNYGAPVRDSIAAAGIVDYLVAIKGKH
jgi:cytochrome c5